MNFNTLFLKSIRIRSELCNYQIVRWRRPKKPFWLGIAKTKMFVVPQPKIVPTPEEKAVMITLSTHYNTHLKSLMEFIKVDNPILKENVSTVDDAQNVRLVSEKDILESLKMNESWNKESAKRRDERTKINLQKEMENAIKELDECEEMKMKQMAIIEEIVRKEKELSASYITPENLEEAIENCLNKVECYDFAIDLEGNRYSGRETLPPKPSATHEEILVENSA